MNGQGYVGIGDQYLLGSIAAVVLGGTSILGGSGTYAGSTDDELGMKVQVNVEAETQDADADAAKA